MDKTLKPANDCQRMSARVQIAACALEGAFWHSWVHVEGTFTSGCYTNKCRVRGARDCVMLAFLAYGIGGC